MSDTTNNDAILAKLTESFKDLSLAELTGLLAMLQEEIVKKQEQDTRQKIAEIHSIAASIGMTVEIHPQTGEGKKVPPKYINFDNPTETWSGRGNEPRWLVEKLKEGHKKEDFLVS